MEGEPMTPIPAGKWLREIKNWIATLDYEGVVATGRQKAFDLLPALSLEHDGLTVVFKPIARRRDSNAQPTGRPIGVQSFEAVWVRSWEAIQHAVRKKASRYGEQDTPYLIAINGVGDNCDYEEFERALYGPDGLWRVGGRRVHTRVSGILAVLQLIPSTIGCANACIFHNPHAVNSYSGQLCQLSQARATKEGVKYIPGIGIPDILGIPPRWPHFEGNETAASGVRL
jgi:hypothetical protein